MSLTSKQCTPCEWSTPPLKGDALKKYMDELGDAWALENEKKIFRHFHFNDFKEAMNFVNRIADLAETEGHHPDISIHWNKVTLALWTHAIGGLSESDFIVAAKINRLIA